MGRKKKKKKKCPVLLNPAWVGFLFFANKRFPSDTSVEQYRPSFCTYGVQSQIGEAGAEQVTSYKYNLSYKGQMQRTGRTHEIEGPVWSRV